MTRSPARLVLALISALAQAGAPVAEAALPLAQAIPAEPSAFQRLDKLEAQATAIHFSNVTAGRPSATVYVTVRNVSTAATMISTATIEASLVSGSTVFTQATPQLSTLREMTPTMTPPTGTPGPLMLARGASAVVVMRFDLMPDALRSPLTLNLREKPLTPLLPGGGRTTLRFPAYSPIGHRLPEGRLQTPPPHHTTTGIAGDGRFIEAGPWRVRLDEAVYGSRNAAPGQPTGLTVVEATVQNTRNIPIAFQPAEWGAVLVQSDGVRTPQEHLHDAFSINKVPLRTPTITVPPGASVAVRMSHVLADAPAQHRARQWVLTHRPPGGQPATFELPMPMPRSVIEGTADPSQRPQDPTVGETVSTHGQPFQSLSRLAVTVFGTQYGFVNATHTRGTIGINARVKNISPGVVKMEPDLLHARLEVEGRVGIVGNRPALRYGNNPTQAVDLHPGQEATVFIIFRAEGEELQRAVRAVTFYERAAPGGPDVANVRIALPPPNTPPATPQPTPAPIDPAARLKTFEGRYRTNRGTTLTFQVEGQELVGRGGTPQLMNREEVKLTLHEDGSLRGTLRDTEGAGRFTWYQLNLRFAPDGARFAGQGAYMHASLPPISYTGERIAETTAATTAAAPTLGAAAGGFTDGGYLSLRADMVRHSLDQWGQPRVEVGLTARNTQGQRRSLQHNSDRFFLITADGVEHRMDGNYYGASAEDRLIQTVWVEKDEEAQVTYVFASVPATARPTRLIVRDSMNRQQLASIDLSATPSQRPAVTGGAAGQPGGGLGQAIMLDRYEVTLEKIERGPDGNWHSIMTVKNAGDTPLRPVPGSLNAVLYGADGQARHAGGNWYDPASTTPVVLRDPGVLQPGAQFRVRRVHSQSTGVNPVRFRAQEGPKSGEVSLSGAP